MRKKKIKKGKKKTIATSEKKPFFPQAVIKSSPSLKKIIKAKKN